MLNSELPDPLGRQYFTVAVEAGRLGISLVEKDDVVGVYVGAFESNPGTMYQHKQRIQVGDRLVMINEIELLHDTLSEVISMLIKTNSEPRQLTFLRAASSRSTFDIAKKILIKAPPGSLGVELISDIEEWAVIDTIHPSSPLQNAHRGFRIIRINDVDVSSMNQESIVAHLGTIRDESKVLELYRLVPMKCTAIFYQTCSDENSINFPSPSSMVIMSPRQNTKAFVIGVNGKDLTTYHPSAAQETIQTTPMPRKLLCYSIAQQEGLSIVPTQAQIVAPPPTPTSCNTEYLSITVTDSSLGLQIDGNTMNHAKVTAFTDSEVSKRSYYAPYVDAVPGMCIASVNGVDVFHVNRDKVLAFINKLSHVSRTIGFASESNISSSSAYVEIQVPSGSLLVDFDGNFPNCTKIASFRQNEKNEKGVLEQSGKVGPGSILIAVNDHNVSCLKLHETIDLLKKLVNVPKKLTFTTHYQPTVDIYVPSGSLGLTFQKQYTDKVVIESIAVTSPIQWHGLIATNSQLVRLDGFDLSNFSPNQAANLLKSLSNHPKVLTFTLPTANTDIQLLGQENIFINVQPGPLGIQFDSALPVSAIIVDFTSLASGNKGDVESNGNVPVGSRLDWIDNMDVRFKPLNEIVALLKDISECPKTLGFNANWSHSEAEPPSPTTKHESTPFVRKVSTTSDISNFQEKLNLTDHQVSALKQRLSLSSDQVADTTPAKVQGNDLALNTHENVIEAPIIPANFSREYVVQTFGWFGSLKKQLSFDSDQKYILIHGYDGEHRSSSCQHLTIASITSVVKGKTTRAFTKKAAANAAESVCLSLLSKKHSFDCIFTSVDDRNALASAVEALKVQAIMGSRKRRIPLSKPPSNRLFEEEYDCWVNVVRLRQWVSSVDEFQQPCHQTPTLLLVLSPISIILKVEPIVHMGPVTAEDFEVLQTSLPPNSRVFCPLKYESMLREGLGSALSSLNLTIMGRHESEIPPAFGEIAEQFANNIPSRCALCDGMLLNKPYPGQEPRPCVCAGMEAIPSMTDSIIRSLFETSSKFWQAQPWLHMRINHVVRVEMPGSSFRYVQILGGTGCCDVALMVHKDWSEVQNENWSVSTMKCNSEGFYSVVKAEFQPPGQGCRSWKDLDYIESQTRLGTPLMLPDPNNSDPITQPVLPLFTRISIKRKSGNDIDVRQVAATMEEIVYLQVAMSVIMTILDDDILQAVPNSPVGDYRKFYAFDTTLPITPSMVAYNKLPEDKRKVHVRYPALDDPSQMSHLQVIGVEMAEKPSSDDQVDTTSSAKKKKKKRKNKIKDDSGINGDMDVQTLARMREIMTLKAAANSFYQKGLYKEAYQQYTQAIEQFTAFKTKLELHHQKDPQMVLNGDNLYSNRAQAALRLEWYEKALEDCNHVIPFIVSHCANIYVIRCLHARARALAATYRYDEAFDDWHVLAIESQKGNKDVPPAGYLAEQGQQIQSKLNTCNTPMKWNELPATGKKIKRFFHSTVLHPDAKSILVFGGRSTTMFGTEHDDALIHQYMFDSKKWITVSGTGQKPPCLAGHTAVMYGRDMYVYGGSQLNDEDLIIGALYQFNVDSHVWKHIRAPNEPKSVRNEHIACVYGTKMLIYGGIQGNSTGNSFDVYDFVAKRWSMMPENNKANGPPAILSLHMAWIHEKTLFIFGGKVDTADFYEYRSVIHGFDLEKQTWLNEIPLSTSSGTLPLRPGPRSETQAVYFENRMYQFGGYAELTVGSKYHTDGYCMKHHDDNTISWSKMFPPKETSSRWPSGRAGCTFTLDPSRRRAILFGGYETMQNDIVYGDLWELELPGSTPPTTPPQMVKQEIPKTPPKTPPKTLECGGRHRYDFGGADHLCVFLSGDFCITPFSSDYSNCSVRCWGVGSGALTRQIDVDNVSDYWAYPSTKASSQGIVTTLAGSGNPGFKDGPVATAQFAYPRGIAVDSNNNIYVADTNNHRIRMIKYTTQAVLTIAGTGVEGYTDGPASSAQFSFPSGIAVYQNGANIFLYVADTGNHRIRQINLQTNQVSCIAGRCSNGTETASLAQFQAPPQPGLSDGTPNNSTLNSPMGVAVNSQGVVFVADTGNNIIRQIDTSGMTTTLAGNVQAQKSPMLGCPPPCVIGIAGFRDGNSKYAQFNHPTGICIGPANTVLVADDHRIRRVSYGQNTVQGVVSTSRVVTVAGAGPYSYGETDGLSNEASFHVSAVAMSPDQRVFSVSSISNHVRDISQAASVARPITCSTKARDVLSPSGCASYEPPTDSLHYKVSPAMSNIYYNWVNRSVSNVNAGLNILGRTIQTCVGSPPIDLLTTGTMSKTMYDTLGNPITSINQDKDVGSAIQVQCPTNCTGTSPVYGSLIYSDSSSICSAAIHLGVLSNTTTGLLTITLLSNTLYSNATFTNGSVANGITSLSILTNQQAARFFSVAQTPITQVGVQTIAGRPSEILEAANGYQDGTPPLNTKFNGPSGIFLSSAPSTSSFIYIADTLNHRIRAITAVCSKVCENGGVCSGMEACTCAAGWTGDDCTTPICTNCGLRQVCVGPNTCGCIPGYTSPPACTAPLCVQTCANQGVCSAPDTCSCASGWFDSNCTTPVCTQTCGNGGNCTAPNTCTCSPQWQGADCRTPVCSQTCLNGGTCIAPNTCLCPIGWSGFDCAMPVCTQGKFVPHPSAFERGLFRPFNWSMYVPCGFDSWCSWTKGFDCAQRTTSVVATCRLLELKIIALSYFTYFQEHGSNTSYMRYSTQTPYGQDQINLNYPGAPVLVARRDTTPPYTATVDRQLAQAELRTISEGVYVCANNGNCTAPDICVCAPGWAGFDCRTPICHQGYYTPSQTTFVAADPPQSAATNHPSSNGNPSYVKTIESLYPDHYTTTAQTVGNIRFLSQGSLPQGGYACSARSLTQFEKPATPYSPAYYWNFANYYSLYMNNSMYWPPLYAKTLAVWDNTQQGYTRDGIWQYISPVQWQKGTCLVQFQRTCPSKTFSLTADPDTTYRPQISYSATLASSSIFRYTGCIDYVLRGCFNNGTCTAPDTCKCAPGWSGSDCSIPICSPQCVHGTCTNPNRCVCDLGWTGAICTAAICAQDCRNGGKCIAPDTCQCVTWISQWRDGRMNGGMAIFALSDGSPHPTGWTGYDCNTPICTQAEKFLLNVPRTQQDFTALRGTLGKTPCTHVRCPQYDIEVTSNDGTSFQSGCPGIPYTNPVFNGTNAQRQKNWDSYNDALNTGRQSSSLCNVMTWSQGEFSNRKLRVNYGTVAGEGVFACYNHGSCVAPDTCSCADGYTGFDCQTPLCRFLTPSGSVTSCQHSGVCVAKDTCKCIQSPSILFQKYPEAPQGMTGWAGSSCSMAICVQGFYDAKCFGQDPVGLEGCYRCANGGQCVAPDLCACAEGWTGYDCRTPVCKVHATRAIRAQLFTLDEEKVYAFENDPCGMNGGRWGQEIYNGALMGQGNCTLPQLCTCLCKERYDYKVCKETGEFCLKPWSDPFGRSLSPGYTFGTKHCAVGFQGLQDSLGRFQSCHLHIKVPNTWERYTGSFITLITLAVLFGWGILYCFRKRVKDFQRHLKAERRKSRRNSEDKPAHKQFAFGYKQS
ncbi:hypothetical protein THRCLA_00879 [Thraustotheca clavata]|uniref:Uncharacterized protein n=1 Tax=Thraustotheca clavata TaxID=74557 RepID=A0A1W0A9Z9_9STRA|nr:hypothetical protein THRCLA_00879 [Thraustotheca clavata]